MAKKSMKGMASEGEGDFAKISPSATPGGGGELEVGARQILGPTAYGP